MTVPSFLGARGRNRTDYLSLTRRLLYQLSYTSNCWTGSCLTVHGKPFYVRINRALPRCPAAVGTRPHKDATGFGVSLIQSLRAARSVLPITAGSLSFYLLFFSLKVDDIFCRVQSSGASTTYPSAFRATYNSIMFLLSFRERFRTRCTQEGSSLRHSD